MWLSLSKLAALPDDTLVYCGHEYTMVWSFALTSGMCPPCALAGLQQFLLCSLLILERLTANQVYSWCFFSLVGSLTRVIWYMQSNAKFAVSVEPQNAALQSRFEKVKQLRQKGLATVIQLTNLGGPSWLRFLSSYFPCMLFCSSSFPCKHQLLWYMELLEFQWIPVMYYICLSPEMASLKQVYCFSSCVFCHYGTGTDSNNIKGGERD